MLRTIKQNLKSSSSGCVPQSPQTINITLLKLVRSGNSGIYSGSEESVLKNGSNLICEFVLLKQFSLM
uniref:hypothetical protein n=1 Tax=Wolbachia endosymbiont of Trichogramma pretiosum TaxID=125593 RepID=UPI001FDF3A3B|nr:hypothetical protein [Wolbachia endosymbiont of Trichogramma pretiosum]